MPSTAASATLSAAVRQQTLRLLHDAISVRPSLAVMTDHAAGIRARRDASNQAIAARDANLVAQFMMPDITVSVANGPVLAGRDANHDAFAEQFADRAFRGYVREPSEVIVHDPPVRATERGRWTGRWREGAREQVMRGTYVAQWRHTELGWFIQSEIFTPSES